MGPWLVTGFGSFLDVADNPSERLARAVDGAQVAGVPVVGRVLPVTYLGAPRLALELADGLGARGIVGLGVARGRVGVWVEAVGRRRCVALPDNAGSVLEELGEGPDEVAATLNPDNLAALLGAAVSRDAGGYVCNAWAWWVPQYAKVPAAFVHLPAEGMEADRLLQALAALS
jgi:pyrrolidone-carboxylate peptidase